MLVLRLFIIIFGSITPGRLVGGLARGSRFWGCQKGPQPPPGKNLAGGSIFALPNDQPYHQRGRGRLTLPAHRPKLAGSVLGS